MGSLRYRDIFQLLSVPWFTVSHLPLAISRLPACTSHFRMGVAAVDVVVAAGSQGAQLSTAGENLLGSRGSTLVALVARLLRGLKS